MLSDEDEESTQPCRVVKVDLATISRVGALTLESGEELIRTAVIDPAGDFAYFGADISPGRLVKLEVRIGPMIFRDRFESP